MNVTCAQNQSDLQEIADLKGKIFTRADYYDFYNERMRFHNTDPWFQPEHALIIRDQGRIVSHVNIFERPVRFGPAVLKMGGIGDVLTIPSFRGKGCSKLLMNAARDYMTAHAFDISLLFGIPNYYHKFGYMESMNYFMLTMLSDEVELPKENYTVRPVTDADLPAMCALYQDNIQKSHLVVDRTEAYFASRLRFPEHVFVLTDTSGRLVGYANTWDPITSQFMVIEAVTANWDASRALLFEMIKRKPARTALNIKIPPHMPFFQHVRYLGTELTSRCYAEGDGKGMLSIIDWVSTVQKLTPLFDERMAASRFFDFSGSVQIHCQQSVQLDFDEGVLTKCEPARADDTAESCLHTDLCYLVRNVTGYWSVQDLLDQTDSRVTNYKCRELLDVLFPMTSAALLPWDYF